MHILLANFICSSTMQIAFLLWSFLTFQDPSIPVLNLDQANRLAKLPLHCMQTEYPNKLNQTLADESYLLPPKTLHPAFYGCFDWHSSVHGHWMLVALLKQFPNLDDAVLIRQKLEENISAENILQEVAYFHIPQNSSFERTYGWAWVLKLAEELNTWNDPLARQLENNLQPLTDLMVEKYIEFLPKLIYPIRVGEHTNIAFGLSFAYDYAKTMQHQPLQTIIEQRSKDWFQGDTDCPLAWEPSGFDFLSPCFQELDIMRKVLAPSEFVDWAYGFLPVIFESNFSWEPGRVSDRADGKLVHLDGVNFSRAWVMYGLARNFPDLFPHLISLGDARMNFSLPFIVDDNYEGTHWLGSFAIYALIQRPQ
ncbi:DUF2891 domain-containing protein [Mongoliitalea daihaiensis]|uniref:DUF2891 domain-containing protein n=1 Tax=Mongoliitalea daihaiensis TaxID=2782006 RepID=UPI001F1BADCA|nr:DUF2891 domain-containing protein [Mongoliitalea daihaiensis]UJP64212.1 DUF2891 domain-containing protein [Mongoliitalea daihaiensis]